MECSGVIPTVRKPLAESKRTIKKGSGNLPDPSILFGGADRDRTECLPYGHGFGVDRCPRWIYFPQSEEGQSAGFTSLRRRQAYQSKLHGDELEKKYSRSQRREKEKGAGWPEKTSSEAEAGIASETCKPNRGRIFSTTRPTANSTDRTG